MCANFLDESYAIAFEIVDFHLEGMAQSLHNTRWIFCCCSQHIALQERKERENNKKENKPPSGESAKKENVFLNVYYMNRDRMAVVKLRLHALGWKKICCVRLCVCVCSFRFV